MSIVPPGFDNSGDSGRLEVKVSSLETFDGSTVDPPAVGVTAVVGANNSGKTTFLREAHQRLVSQSNQLPTMQLIKELALLKRGAFADLTAWMLKHNTYVEKGSQKGFAYPGGGDPISVDQAHTSWQLASQEGIAPSLGGLAPFFLHYVTATNRAGGISPHGRRADIAQHAENPMHTLEDNPELMAQVRSLSERIFRQTLTLDPLSGSVQLRVGQPAIPAPPVDAITPEYRAAVAKLPPLQEQGDGMTGVLGLLVPILCGSYQIVMIDEPEAFLHPPQAKIVGQVLGELAQERSLQILIATHDRNIIVGLLQSSASVSVIRLDRKIRSTRVHKLEHERLRELWSNPVLRYSNVLDGIFHRAVVLCEGERDCTFYTAALESAGEKKELLFPPGDVLFVPTGGKDGIPGMARSLGAVSVPTVAIPDLDLLDDQNKVRTIVEAFGGEWSVCEKDYRVATEHFRQPRAKVTNAQILHQVTSVLSEHPDALYDWQARDHVKAAIRIEVSPWEQLKEFGDRAFRGQALLAVQRLFNYFEGLGIAVVRAGVLENLAPDVQSRKGAAWLPEALAKRAYLGSLAQEHIDYVIAAIELRLSLD